MNLARLFPVLKPRRSFESVLRELINGLRDGTIILDGPKPAAHSEPSNGRGAGSDFAFGLASETSGATKR